MTYAAFSGLPVRKSPENYFAQKVLAAVLRWKIMAASLIIIVGAVLFGVHVNQWIILSRTVTQTQIAEGWKASGIEMATHTIQQKENLRTQKSRHF